LNSRTEWENYTASGKKPKNIPSNPRPIYLKDWTSWGDFLGTGSIAPINRIYRSFEEARIFVRALNLKNQKEWFEYCKSGKLPNDIPIVPGRTYKNKGWKSFGDWLGTGMIANQLRQYRSFAEARRYVHSLGFKTHQQWKEYCNSGKKPEDIPSNPWAVYEKGRTQR